MKKNLAGVLFVCIFILLSASKANSALTKRSYYDLFGDSLNSQYWVFGLLDDNGGTNNGSILRGEGWGFFADQVYNFNFNDKYKKTKIALNMGFHDYPAGGTYWSTDLLDVSLTPLTFQRVWWPGIRGTYETQSQKFILLFSRTSSMTVVAAGSSRITANTYFAALRDEFKIKEGDINLVVGGNFINHWKENSSVDDNSFVGNIDNSVPSLITIRFSDDSPEDNEGAKPTLTELYCNIDDGSSKIYPNEGVISMPVEADGLNYREYSFAVPSTAKKAVITIKAANDYKIEVKTDQAPTYVKIASALGNPKDGVVQTISYSYGVPTANQFIGFDVKGDVYGAKVNMELEYNLKWRKFPNSEGDRTADLGINPAFFLKASRPVPEFEKLVISGDLFYIDPNYATSFDGFNYVDDNDDKDLYVDGTASASGGIGGIPIPQYLPYDKDSDGVEDWKESLFLFGTDSPKFLIGDDRNNNGIVDYQENDPYPDYPYKIDPSNPVGLSGYGLSATYDLGGGSTVTGGYDDFGEITTANKTQNILGAYTYKSKIDDFGNIVFYYQIKRTYDNIADNMMTIANIDGSQYIGSDQLLFKNSLLNVAQVESIYSGYKNLTVSNKFRFNNNYQIDDLRNLRWAGFITQVRYDIKPSKVLTISPVWKLTLEKSTSAPAFSAYNSDEQMNAFLLDMVYKVFEKTTMRGGVEYRLVRYPLENTYDYNALVLALQIVSKAGQYPLHLGYERYLTNTPTSPTFAKSETIFLKLYMMK